jgi:hypothetical protein
MSQSFLFGIKPFPEGERFIILDELKELTKIRIRFEGPDKREEIHGPITF